METQPKALRQAIQARRLNLGPIGASPFSTWLNPPVDEAVLTPPESPLEGFRIIWLYDPLDQPPPPLGNDNKIYTYTTGAWVLDPQTDPLTDGMAVMVRTHQAQQNQIFIYNISQNLWSNKTTEIAPEEGRYYTSWVNNSRQAYNVLFNSVLDVNQSGLYSIPDILEDMPVFETIPARNDFSILECLSANPENYIFRLTQVSSGDIFTRIKKENVWEPWKKLIIPEGSGSGGHILVDEAGLELEQRTKLKGEDFVEFYNPLGQEFSAARLNPTKIKQVEYVKVYQMPETAKALLEAPQNWNSESIYIGETLTGCKAGMKHRDANFVYEMFTSTSPVRTARTADKHAVYDVNHQVYIGVQHDLGKKPAVAILDALGNEVQADVVHVDLNNATVTWSDFFTGKVIFN